MQPGLCPIFGSYEFPKIKQNPYILVVVLN
jgi:hypothetical protein